MSKFIIKKTTNRDIKDIFTLICELAKYENLPLPKAFYAKKISKALKGKDPRVHALLAYNRNLAIGYAIYFYTYSTFLARPTLFLEDIFILPEFRKHGVGSRLFSECIKIAKKQGCGRMEWCVLDWNKLAHNFYKKYKPKILKEWIYYRIPLGKNSF